MDTELKCPECGDRMILKKSERYGLFYGCIRWPECDATHGAHEDGRPLGIPGNAETRRARMDAHEAFDSLRLECGWSRGRGYIWLAERMGMPTTKCHIGRFNMTQCRQVISICEKAWPRPIDKTG